ncbi:hypothetical protein Zm00014a_019313 [Zea mays]|uniref:Aldose 1-epimerase n=1 Tax=Zea mays TaxID=4577 RepID=A0A3L6GA35_MAIZE|nr:hypothetical protein Zm00014a_019313 [Zea mays]
MATRRELSLALLCVCLAACALAPGPADASKMVGVYELRKGDFSVRLTNWGARVMSVVLPDRKGNLADVVLGRDTVAEYVGGDRGFSRSIWTVKEYVAGANRRT